MKIKNFMAMMLASVMAFSFTACDDDDDDEVKVVEATIDGTLKMSVMGEFYSATDATVSVLIEGDSLTLSTPAITGMGQAVESFDITGIPVSRDANGNYILGTKSYEATAGSYAVSGEITSGTIYSSLDSADIVMTLTPGSMPMAIDLVFCPVVEIVNGDITGSLEMVVQGMSLGASEATIGVYIEGDSLTISTPAITGMNMTVESFDITGIPVSKDANGNYILGKKTYEGTAGDYAVVGEITSGTIYSSLDSAEIVMTLTPGAMPMAITLTFGPVVEEESASKFAVSANGSEVISSDELKLTFDFKDDGTATISMPEISYGSPMTIPTFSITGVTYTEADGVCTIAEQTYSIAVSDDKTASGTIAKSTVAKDGSAANLSMTLKYGAMPLEMTITYVVE